MSPGDFAIWGVVILGLIIGYAVVAFLINNFQREAVSHKEYPIKGEKPQIDCAGRNPATIAEQGDNSRARHEEIHHAEVLGLKGPATKDEIRRAYGQLIAKYQLDKVDHLGEEFQKLAEQKTREINSAYEYFRQKYHII